MDIRLLPAGTRGVIDANIFVYYLSVKPGDCTDFLSRVAHKELEAYVTTIIIAEALHRQMLVEAVTKGLITPSKALKKLKDDPNLIKSLTDYATEMEKLLKLPLRVIEVTATDSTQSYDLRQAHGLFVNDSINLACAGRLGIEDVITHDADFARVPHIKIWEPTDV